MPFIRQYTIGWGEFIQREISHDLALRLLTTGQIESSCISVDEFPDVSIWDDAWQERHTRHAADCLLRSLSKEKAREFLKEMNDFCVSYHGN